MGNSASPPIADAERTEACQPEDHSRSPRRQAEEIPVIDRSMLGLSAELSRILDEHMSGEERSAEEEAALRSRFRDELSQAEAAHL